MKFSINIVKPKDINLEVSELIPVLQTMIPDIVKKAREEQGDEVITLILMHEYALGGKTGIPKEETKRYLAELNQLIHEYENVLLIPGTIVSTTVIQPDEKDRIERKNIKLQERYQESSSKYHIHADRQLSPSFQDEQAKFMESLGKETEKAFLQNTAYLLFKNENHSSRTKIMKHRKARPTYETAIHIGCIYNQGKEEYVYNVKLKNASLDLGVLICLEKRDISWNESLKKNPPMIELVLSNTISINENQMYGALNIHVDNFDYITNVYFNPKHPRFKEIEEIKVKRLMITTDKMLVKQPNLTPLEWSQLPLRIDDNEFVYKYHTLKELLNPYYDAGEIEPTELLHRKKL
jgi:hypothetical protein